MSTKKKLIAYMMMCFVMIVALLPTAVVRAEETGTVPENNSVTSISLDKTAVILDKEKEITLVVSVSPEDASNNKVNWKSSDPKVASVNEGKVTAVGDGIATITVTVISEENETLTATCRVGVGKKAALEIAISEANGKLKNHECASVNWEKFQIALENATKIAEEENATSEALDTAVKDLNDAMNTYKLTAIEKKEATCTEDGNEKYYKCECGKFFSDEDGKLEIQKNEWIIQANHPMLLRNEGLAVEATCETPGHKGGYTCKACGKHFENPEGTIEIVDWEIPVKEHELTINEGSEATCTAAGSKAYFMCQREGCGKYFYVNENGTPGAEIVIPEGKTLEDVITIPVVAHKLTMTSATAATCTTAGNDAYYTCEGCNQYFDEKGETKIDANSWIIPAKGHQIVEVLNKPGAHKEGSLKYKCKNCAYQEGKTLALPKTEMTITLGEFVRLVDDKDAENYKFTLSKYKIKKDEKRKGRITIKTARKNWAKLKGKITLTVTAQAAKGKSYIYDVNVKLEILAPKWKKDVNITETPITIGGVRGHRFKFNYNIEGASRIKVRVKGKPSLNEACKKYLKNPKSNGLSYLNIQEKTVKQLNGKVTFIITAYYKNKESKKLVKTITVK